VRLCNFFSASSMEPVNVYVQRHSNSRTMRRLLLVFIIRIVWPQILERSRFSPSAKKMSSNETPHPHSPAIPLAAST